MVRPPNSPDGRRTPRFDRIVVVDWSAHTGPKRGPDSIWLCAIDVDGSDTHTGDDAGDDTEVLENIPTRLEAHSRLRDLVSVNSDARPTRTLLTIDVALGYPSGTASAAGLTDDRHRPWESMWRHLSEAYCEGPRNRPERASDRWTVATDLNRRLVESGAGLHFWGCPPRRAGAMLTTRRPPPGRLATERSCEVHLRAKGLRPFSVWQLLGAGAVGSQTLTAIPVLDAIRNDPDLAGGAVVWPFETGIDGPGVAAGIARAHCVIAEIWPGTLPSDVVDRCEPPHSAGVKDARQVTALARHLRDLDREDRLGEWFCPDLDPDTAATVVGEEGWVLGLTVGDDHD